ncbi:MAG: alpha-hydroxy acid oxidase [Alphaproteobacteria bacterium]
MTKTLQRTYNVEDTRRLAERRLPRGLYESIERGTEDEVALRNNVAALQRIKFRPRMLVDVSKRSLRSTLFGQPLSMPVAIAPTGSAGLVWYQGELELARAAAAAGIPFALATRSMNSVEEIAEKAGGTLWLQLYVWNDRDLTYRLVERAEKAGFQGLIVTADTPVNPNREYNLRNGYGLPFVASRTALLDMVRHPRWLVGVLGRYIATSGMPRFENQPNRPKITRGAESSVRSGVLTWDDIKELRRRWPRTFMVKGLLRADDAVRAVDLGADAVIVSNHGGRNLDSAPATIDVLPEIVAAVGQRAAILVDSGFRRGSDIAKAIALGASAVLIGRPTLYGTAIAGAAGATHVLGILRHELSTTLAMIGCPDVQDLGPDFLQMPGQGGEASEQGMDRHAQIP